MHYTSLVTISIVSHGQAALLHPLLCDLDRLSENNFFEVIVTVNLPEDESLYVPHSYPLSFIRNNSPKGFGDNHNSAFLKSSSEWFVVVNPDIRIQSLDFVSLLGPFNDKSVAAVAPIIISANGDIEDSARKFPTLFSLVKRVILRSRELDYDVNCEFCNVDWVGGMFVAFRRSAYQVVNGFDSKRFFMYFEDVDICRRLTNAGWRIILNTNIRVVHLAQRASHNNLRHLRWHLASACRYLLRL